MRRLVMSARRWGVAAALVVCVLVIRHADSPAVTASADGSPCYGVSAVADPERNLELVRDCNILLELRNALAGDGKLDWSANESIHFWDGVTLGGSPLRVRGLRLSGRGLTGEVPSELGKLTALLTLNLSYNDLEGGIPAEFGALADLQYLYLHHNQLTGAISAVLGGLADLRHLILNDNDLTGDIPRELGDLRNLEYLYLDDNGLDGCIPRALIGNSDLTLRTDRLEACPKEEPLVPGTCMNGVVVANPARNPELVRDCVALLEVGDALAGGASLNWSVNASIPGVGGGWYWRLSGAGGRVRTARSRFDGQHPARLGRSQRPGGVGPRLQSSDWEHPCGVGKPDGLAEVIDPRKPPQREHTAAVGKPGRPAGSGFRRQRPQRNSPRSNGKSGQPRISVDYTQPATGNHPIGTGRVDQTAYVDAVLQQPKRGVFRRSWVD